MHQMLWSCKTTTTIQTLRLWSTEQRTLCVLYSQQSVSSQNRILTAHIFLPPVMPCPTPFCFPFPPCSRLPAATRCCSPCTLFCRSPRAYATLSALSSVCSSYARPHVACYVLCPFRFSCPATWPHLRAPSLPASLAIPLLSVHVYPSSYAVPAVPVPLLPLSFLVVPRARARLFPAMSVPAPVSVLLFFCPHIQA